MPNPTRDEITQAADSLLRYQPLESVYGSASACIHMVARAVDSLYRREDKMLKALKRARLFVRIYQGFLFWAKLAESKWLAESGDAIMAIDAAIKASEEGKG